MSLHSLKDRTPKRTYEALEDRRLLAADLLVETDSFEPSVHGDEVTRIVRVYNNGDAPANDTHVRIWLTNELRAIDWTRESGFAKTVSLGDAKATDIVFQGTTPNQFLGRHFSTVGDVNGDGTVDYVFNNKFVVFGVSDLNLYAFGEDTLDGTNGFTVSNTGRPTQVLGDINADGFDDLSFGAHVLFGASSGTHGGVVDLNQLDASHGFTVDGAEAIYGVGDVNNDGQDDIALDMKDNSVPNTSYLVWETEGVGSDGLVEQAEIMDDRSVGIRLQGAIQGASPAGDLNNDGFADVVFNPLHGEIKASVLFGRTAFPAETPNLTALSGEQGLMIEELLQTRAASLVPAQVESLGDVNADGVDDLLITYQGLWECDCTASDKETFPVAGGSAIVFGSTDLATEGYLQNESSVTKLDVVVGYDDARPRSIVTDINGDNVNDIAMIAGGSTYVVFGGEGLTSHDFGQANSEYDGFNGQNGFRVDEIVNLVDVDGDSILDMIHANSTAMVNTKRFAGKVSVSLNPFGQFLNGPDTTSGDWNINEAVNIPAGTSLIYTANASVRRNPDTIVSYAVEGAGLQTPPTAKVIQSTLTGINLFDRTFEVQFNSPDFDKNTVGDDDVEVVFPNGDRQIAEFVEAPLHGPTGVTAIYRLPIHGDWMRHDGSTYEIWVRPNEVTGNGGQAIPASKLTSFTVDLPRENAMTARLSSPNALLNHRSDQAFTVGVRYQAEFPIAFNSINSGDIYVELPDGRISVPSMSFSQSNPSGTSIGASYDLGLTLSEKGNALWDMFDNGEYKIYLADRQVEDVAGRELPGQLLGSFNVDILFDQVPPEASAFAFDLTQDRIGGHKIEVSYSDNERLDENTIGQGDIAVLQPNGEFVEPIFRGLKEADDVIGIYRLPAPGGEWDHADNGEYQVVMLPKQVFDRSLNSVGARLLTTFTIQIDDQKLFGDIDGDKRVDFADFLLLSQNYGKDETSSNEGDLDGDGRVNFADFLLLSQNYGRSIR